MIDWSISFSNVLTIIAFLAGGILFVAMVRGRVDSLSDRMLAVENELKQLVIVLVQQGRHEERMNAMDARLSGQGNRLDQMIERINRHLDRERAD